MPLFLSLKLIPLTNTVLLTYSAPIWIPLISWILHRPKSGRAVWLGVAVGFIGITLILQPAKIELTWGEPFALCAAILLALALLSIRWLIKTEAKQVFYSTIFFFLPFSLFHSLF